MNSSHLNNIYNILQIKNYINTFLDNSNIISLKCSDMNFSYVTQNVHNTCTLGSTIVGTFVPDIRSFFINLLFTNDDNIHDVQIQNNKRQYTLSRQKIIEIKQLFKRYIFSLLTDNTYSRHKFENDLHVSKFMAYDEDVMSIIQNTDLNTSSSVFYIYSLFNMSTDVFKLNVLINKYNINNININKNITNGNFPIQIDATPHTLNVQDGMVSIKKNNNDSLTINYNLGFSAVLGTFRNYSYNIPTIKSNGNTNYHIDSPFCISPLLYMGRRYSGSDITVWNYNLNSTYSPFFGTQVLHYFFQLGREKYGDGTSLYTIDTIFNAYLKLYFGYFIHKFYNNSFSGIGDIDANLHSLMEPENVNDFPKFNNNFINYCINNVHVSPNNLECLIIKYVPCREDRNVDSKIYNDTSSILTPTRPLPNLLLKKSLYVNMRDNNKIYNYKLQSVYMGIDAYVKCEGELANNVTETGHSVVYINCDDSWYLINDEHKTHTNVIMDKHDFVNGGQVMADMSDLQLSVNKRESAFMYKLNEILTFDVLMNTKQQKDIDDIKKIYASNQTTHGWFKESMKTSNYIQIVLRNEKQIIGIVGIDNNTLELGDDAIHKNYQGKNLYLYLLEKRIEYLKHNAKKGTIYYLFTNIPICAALHTHIGMTYKGIKTKNFTGENGKMYHGITNNRYHTFMYTVPNTS